MPRVRELEVFRLALPYGRRPESILVKLTDYGGMTGWGEIVQPAERRSARSGTSGSAVTTGQSAARESRELDGTTGRTVEKTSRRTVEGTSGRTVEGMSGRTVEGATGRTADGVTGRTVEGARSAGGLGAAMVARDGAATVARDGADGQDDQSLAKTWATLAESLAPALLGVDWEHPDELGTIPGGTAVDLACWDLWARMRGVPLAHALGGSRTSVMATVRLSAERSLEAMIARVNRHVCAGYAHVTLDVHPGWDVEPVRAVRQAYPALTLAVDGRGAYTGAPADITALEALAAYDVTAIERPFGGPDSAADLDLHGELRERVSSLVAIEVHSVRALEEAIAARAGSALLLRPSRFGSLRAVRTAHDLAMTAGWEITAAGGAGTGLARAATVAVASLPGCTLPSDVTEPPRSAQIVTPPVGASGGVVAVPLTQPGLGHLVDEDRVRRLAGDSFKL
ncbi:enolase C-terminal domain-like protein [Sphaerisporangium corydalis]|uniref:Enolase C-terminal domain-like protein n=1 Tax=Sphaerisporangium corydalis TaxID=1441875 RepID=A0ABV9E7P2_9ACTN|nr:enolase C-terminal domain-like protein [Sphaerisporangium corydalis]